MGTLWKLLLPLVLVLPLAAFVAGSLISAANDDPPPREPIVLETDRDHARSPAPARSPENAVVTPRPRTDEADEQDDDADDRQDDDRQDNGADDGPAGATAPGAGDVGDDDGDDDQDERDDDGDDDDDDGGED